MKTAQNAVVLSHIESAVLVQEPQPCHARRSALSGMQRRDRSWLLRGLIPMSVPT